MMASGQNVLQPKYEDSYQINLNLSGYFWWCVGCAKSLVVCEEDKCLLQGIVLEFQMFWKPASVVNL